MKKVSLIWIAVTFLNSAVSAGKWLETSEGNIFYVQTEHKFTWYAAKNICTGLKMSLISMDSAKKTKDVYNLYRAHFGNTKVELWTGGHDHNVSHQFEWISTGQAIGYTNWIPSHPTNNGYHCIKMHTSSSLQWYDYSCNFGYGFICEEAPLQDVTNTEVKLLKASLDNQTTLLKEKTEELDSLRNDIEKIQNTLDIQTNLKLEFDELKKSYEEVKQKQEEFAITQKLSEQQITKQNETLNNLKNAQISSDIEIKQMLKDQDVTNTELKLLKASLDNQTTLLKEKTEELDSLRNDIEKIQNTLEIQTNLKLEFDELKKSYEEVKQKQEEFAITQKLSEQQITKQNETLNNLNNAQISSDIEIKQMLKDQLQKQNQIIDALIKSRDIKHTEVIKSSGNHDISDPISCETQAALLKAKSEDLEALKNTNEMLLKELFGVLHKSYELNTNRTSTTPNKHYNINFHKNSN